MKLFILALKAECASGCPSVAAFGQQNKFVAEAPLLSLNFLRPFHIADRGSEEV